MRSDTLVSVTPLIESFVADRTLSTMDALEAIRVCDAVKHYGTQYVLNGLNMKVPYGTM